MKRKRYSVEQIVAILKQAEVGVAVAAPIRQAWISEQTLPSSLLVFALEKGVDILQPNYLGWRASTVERIDEHKTCQSEIG